MAQELQGVKYTLSYSPRANGWTSFHSYYPEWMIGMNNFFYTFSRGLIYKHYDPKALRNSYYGTEYNSTIRTVFNDAPIEAKMFKTLQLEGNSSWGINVLTDMDRGEIDSTWFEQKEGDYYAYIRRYSNMEDLDLLSAQGIGDNDSVTGTAPASLTIDFDFELGSIVGVGDVLYYEYTAGSIRKVGTITSRTSKSVVVGTSFHTPSAGDYMLFMKSSVIESYGVRGYFMEVQLTNSSTTEVELFSIGSEAFKSFP